MKRKCILLLILLGAVSCSDWNDPSIDNPRRSLSLTTKQGEFNSAGQNFNFNLIKQADIHAQGDWLISPFSMQCLLGMLLNGAQGETSHQICQALGYGTDESADVNTYYQSIFQQLPTLDNTSNLLIANALFAKQAYPIKAPFKDRMKSYFQAEVENIESERVWTKTINAWCRNHTNGLIPTILKEDNNASIIALNALYFNAPWTCAFPKSNTTEELFYPESAAPRKVKMMKMEGEGRFFLLSEQAHYQLISLPYGNGAYSMYVLLPKKGYSIHSIIQELDFARFNQACMAMRHPGMVELWIPRFNRSGDKSFGFNEILSDMGMPLLFHGGDFNLISERLEAFSLIQQNTAISVTEEGTEAAAITQAIGIGLSDYEVFHADHPFFYMIRENSSGLILFAGCFTGEDGA